MPVAIIARRGNMLISFAIAAGIMTVYYVFYSWAQVIAVEGSVPAAVALWIPAGILFLVGIVVTFKVLRV